MIDTPGHAYDGCEVCRRYLRVGHRKRVWRRMDQRVEIDGRPTITRPDVAHGSASTYRNWGCRCAPCTAANAEAKAGHRRRRHAARVEVGGRLVVTDPGVEHGTEDAYANWGCRCAPCTAASTANQSHRRSVREQA